MKVTCPFCHKQYDNRISNNLCPYCGKLAHGKYTFTNKPKVKIESKFRNWVRIKLIKPLKKKLIQVLSRKDLLHVINLLLFLVLLIYPFCKSLEVKWMCSKAYEQVILEEDVKRTKIHMGEPFNYEDKEGVYQISIDKAVSIANLKGTIQENYELICISYHVTSKSDSVTGTENISSDGYIYGDIEMLPCLTTKSGASLEPMNVSDVESILSSGEIPIRDERPSKSFDYQRGKIYYLTRKNDVSGMQIVSYLYEDNYYKPTGVKECYIMNKLEVNSK